MLDESLVLCRAIGEPEGTAFTLDGLARLALVEGDHARASSSLKEALALARKIGNVSATAAYLADFGIVALHQSDYRLAATLFEEALGFAPQVEDDLLTGECLWGMAIVAASSGEPVRAVRLWGAAEALGYALHLHSDAIRLLQERLLALTRETLGRDAFQVEWTTGQVMRREDAITYALANNDAAS